uniref:3'-5' exonuclease n=1 Tax=Staphylococcus haemolyticus TaxID=1283 RepID=UPI0028CBB5D1
EGQIESGVSVMRMEWGKGLEFRIVLLMGMEEWVFAHIGGIKSDDEHEMEEEGGICYVGIRRGEEVVYIREGRCRMLYGG